MRRWVARGLVAVVAIEVVLGLVPFTVERGDQPVLVARCRGALIEWTPEAESGGEWFSYTPNADRVPVEGTTRAAFCGDEARRRLVPALLVTLAGALVVCAVLARQNRRDSTAQTEPG